MNGRMDEWEFKKKREKTWMAVRNVSTNPAVFLLRERNIYSMGFYCSCNLNIPDVLLKCVYGKEIFE